MFGKHLSKGKYSLFFKKRSKKDFGDHLVPIMPNIWRFALSLSGRPDIADDLTQSTCLRALEKQSQFKSDGNLTAWTLTICRSIWLNELRSIAVRKTGGMETANADDLIDNSLHAEMNIFAREVYTKVMNLPEAQRTTVELVYVQQFTYSEAAHILDVPIGTIMSRLATARNALSKLNLDELPRTKGNKK